jgi:hypothetical protein
MAAIDRIYTHCRHKKSPDVVIRTLFSPCFRHSKPKRHAQPQVPTANGARVTNVNGVGVFGE